MNISAQCIKAAIFAFDSRGISFSDLKNRKTDGCCRLFFL